MSIGVLSRMAAPAEKPAGICGICGIDRPPAGMRGIAPPPNPDWIICVACARSPDRINSVMRAMFIGICSVIIVFPCSFGRRPAPP